MSTTYHPKLDGASKRSNKMINQCLQYHVDCNQMGWNHALPCICFDMMNTVNSSTGFSPFQLCMGCLPCVIPPLVACRMEGVTNIHTTAMIERLALDLLKAKDNMLQAKISQSLAANKHHTDHFPFEKGSWVVLSTLHRRQDYKAKNEKQVAKFMPWYNRSYLIMDTVPEILMVTVDMLNHPNSFLTFHTSQVCPFVENDKDLFPSWELTEPPPVFVNEEEEYLVDRILDEWRRGQGSQYLVHWLGYGPEEDHWLAGHELSDCEALDVWLAKQNLVASSNSFASQ